MHNKPPAKFIAMLSLILVLTIVAAYLLLRKTPVNADNPAQAIQTLSAPPNWPKIQALLQQNALPAIRIRLLNEKPARRDQSKFGGQPYWPANKTYPTGKNGQPLAFLAQINFSELDGVLADYPSQGLLQFFIADDDLYGIDFIDQQLTLEKYLGIKKNFAVVYHPEIEASTKPAHITNTTQDSDELLPHKGEAAISLSLIQDIANPSDYRFDTLMAPLGKLSEATAEYAYETLNQTPAHKIGGYAYFTQEDPRAYQGGGADWLLLFQMDTDANDMFEVMWGDVGIANFFIRKEDLKALDFDKVWYNWDCH